MMKEFIWPSKPPKGIPFEKSKRINDIVFTGRHAEYGRKVSDTWFPSWAADGNLYSPWADGTVDDITARSTSFRFWLKMIKRENLDEFREKAIFEILDTYNSKKFPANGSAKIIGDDPLNLELVVLGIKSESSDPYGGRYPCANLVYNNIWYYGTYCVDCSDDARGPMPELTSWDTLGPFVGFRISRDFGKTWIDPPYSPENNLFKESGKDGAKLKIGTPHFVDFGKNMEYSPDGKAYLVCHGAERPDALLSWVRGDQIYLIRVEPSIENINDITKYEFFSGNNNRGEAIWSRDFKDIRPLIEWENHCGCVTVTYCAPIEKYFMFVSDVLRNNSTYNVYMLEADRINGPWKLITYMEKFGGAGYFVNIPSKFISDDGNSMWLCYSANWMQYSMPITWEIKPVGSEDTLMSLQEIKLV